MVPMVLMVRMPQIPLILVHLVHSHLCQMARKDFLGYLQRRYQEIFLQVRMVHYLLVHLVHNLLVH